jgi:dUTP pyrophosphatase
MKVRIKLLNNQAVMPRKAHSTDAGFDLVATSRVFDDDGNVVYGTGLAFEIPEGYVGLIFPRSSISKYDLSLSNSVGVIDAHYRGEVTCKMKPTVQDFKIRNVDGYHVYEVGERICQLIIMPIPDIEFEKADELSDTDRSTNGYGSTGK